MGPVKNPPSPQPNLRKDHSSSVSEDMAPAAKSRRLLNSCLIENQKSFYPDVSTRALILHADDKKIEEASLDIPYLSENNENAVTTVKKPASLNTNSSSTSPPVGMSAGEVIKNNSEVTNLPELSIFETTNGGSLENGTGDCGLEDQKSIENHNSNTSSAPEDMNSPMEVKEKTMSLKEWASDQIKSSLELSIEVKDTLSEMWVESSRLCQDTTRQFASTYFSQTSSSVDKIVDQQSSQGGQPFGQSSAVRRHCSTAEREHKFFDHYLKPHLSSLKTELEVDTESTDESSDEELTFPTGPGNMVSGNESSSLPQSPASTISDFSTLSTSADHSQLPWQTQPVLEKTFPAERNYLRRRAEIHSVWVWLSVKYKDRCRQLKKFNQILMNLPRHGHPAARRREQLMRSSSPESTPTLFTGPSSPVSCSEASGLEAEAQNSTTPVMNGGDDATMTCARVRPFAVEKTSTSGLSPTRPMPPRTIRPCVLTRCSELLDTVAGPSTVQCHCQYPEVYPCILCCGAHVDRELNPAVTARTTRLQLPPPEKIYPRHKLDPSFHEKLSRPADCCHSLSYDESFVSRRPRMVFFSQSRSQQASPHSMPSQHRPHVSPGAKSASQPAEPAINNGERAEAEAEHRHSPPFMRRKRGRRKQHPYSRANFYSPEMAGEATDNGHRIPANFCKQRPFRQQASFRPRHHPLPQRSHHNHQQQHKQQQQQEQQSQQQGHRLQGQSRRPPTHDCRTHPGHQKLPRNLIGLEHSNERQTTCTTVPATRRTVLSHAGSLADEDTASVSSSGGSVKSMRSVCSSRVEARRRSEESNACGRTQTDIETPLWRRLPAGMSAVHEDSAAVMHLLSVREREKKDVSPAYHLMMLEESSVSKTGRVEDTSDRIYMQRHKIGEVTERTTNMPTNKAMEEMCLQPGELQEQVRR